MKSTKHLGIYMDHSSAYLIELTIDTIVASIVESQATLMDDASYLRRDEGLMHNIDHFQRSDFYKRLSNVMKDYDEIVLFGPTDAKNELHNLLKEDHHFDKIKIEVKPADKMTENQKKAYVRKYFNITG